MYIVKMPWEEVEPLLLAVKAACAEVLLSEDMHSGMLIDGLLIQNPFN